MAHDSQDFSSPQEAIEGYLEALLQDVAEYDEPETRKPAPEPAPASPSAPEESRAESPRAEHSPEPAASDSPGEEGAVFENEDSGTRVFAPPSAREYAREAAAQIQQRKKSLQDSEPQIETVVQDQPSVIMPELKIAEPEVDVATDTDIETLSDLEESVGIAEPEVSVAEAAPETVTETEALFADPAPAEPEFATETESLAAETALQNEQAVSADALQENEGWSNGRPDWAQGRFECLLFVVKGLKLAVPLAELGGIHKLEKDPTPLFGQPGWFLGIVRTNGMNVGLVDTAQWVMSEHINEQHKPDFRFAIRIHNSEWGLACHEVAEAISLDPSEVKWRTKLGRRPWLAGTVVDHMCALIDVAAFARLLDSDKVPVDLQALMADTE